MPSPCVVVCLDFFVQIHSKPHVSKKWDNFWGCWNMNHSPIAFNKANYMYLTYCFILLLPTKKLKAIYFTRKSDKFLTHYACLLREIGAAATKAVQSKMIYNGVLSTGRLLLVLFVKPRSIKISEQKLQRLRNSQNWCCCH